MWKNLCVTLFLLISVVKIGSQDTNDEENMINVHPDVIYIDITNFTTYLKFEMKHVYLVEETRCLEPESCPFTNYSKVAAVLKENLKMAWMNYSICQNLVKDYTNIYPSILYFFNRTGYVYNGSFNYQELLEFFQTFSSPDYKPPVEDFIYLNKKNFDLYTRNITLGVLMSYDHVKDDPTKFAIIGQARSIATQLKKHGISFFLIEYKKNVELCKRMTLEGPFDTVHIRRGKPYPYDKQRSTSITRTVEYSVQHKKFGSTRISNYKQGLYDMDLELKYYSCVFIAVFESKTTRAFPVYAEMVELLRKDYKFFHTFDSKIGRDLGCLNKTCFFPRYPRKLTSPHDEERIKKNILNETDMMNQLKVTTYIKEHLLPLVGYLNTYQHISDIFRPYKVLGILYMETELDSYDYIETKYYLKILWEVAPQFPRIKFAISDRENYESQLKSRDLYETKNEVDFVINANSHHYILTKEFILDNVLNFANDYSNGMLRPTLKSAPLPTNPYDDDGVRVLVGKNFYEIAMNESYDIFILFYVDWCVHCKKVKPIFSELANKYKNNNKLVIAKSNCDKNESPPGYDTSKGYPTIYFAQSNKKNEPIKYDVQNGLSLHDFIHFLDAQMGYSKKVKSNLPPSNEL